VKHPRENEKQEDGNAGASMCGNVDKDQPAAGATMQTLSRTHNTTNVQFSTRIDDSKICNTLKVFKLTLEIPAKRHEAL
jgi:hypothetical protein